MPSRKYFFSSFEEKFITENYPLYGSKYVLKNLNISELKLESFVQFNELKIRREKIDINLNNKYLCYILGLIWADGSVAGDGNRISIKMAENDLLNIKWIFDKICNWKMSIFKKRKKNWKNTIRLSLNNRTFKEFLIENDYDKKSYVSPNKIMSLIPPKKIKYFIRGIFDGDGCFFLKKYKDGTQRLATITSTYEQDWRYMKKIAKIIGCKYYIVKVINNKKKNHKSSYFKVSSGHIIRFGNYIYADFFGLERKYKKFIEIKNSYIYKKMEIRLGQRHRTSLF